mmetsp:Transcript_3480/g.5832  ORF Transcript_3480/g.5832 Transcript_3480/m.5832 type:complete len:165 (-) Transcript_3480:76-570(-)
MWERMVLLQLLWSSALAVAPSRRAAMGRVAVITATAPFIICPPAAPAAVDCMGDCESNCNRVAPKSSRYCFDSCSEYCSQTDRRDGLSGSVSNEAAEVGWASAYDPKRLLPGSVPRGVVYGQDTPPALPDAFNLGPVLRRAVTGGATPNGGPASVEALGGISRE